MEWFTIRLSFLVIFTSMHRRIAGVVVNFLDRLLRCLGSPHPKRLVSINVKLDFN